MTRKMALFAVLLILFGASVGPAAANHESAGWRWRDPDAGPIVIVVNDFTGPEFVCGEDCEYVNWVEETLADYESASDGRLNFRYVRRTEKNCRRVTIDPGEIAVCDRTDMNASGQATIWDYESSPKRIKKALVEIFTPQSWGEFTESTLCEEFGHAVGLLKHVSDPTISCVTGSNGLADPGSHDIEALRELYAPAKPKAK